MRKASKYLHRSWTKNNIFDFIGAIILPSSKQAKTIWETSGRDFCGSIIFMQITQSSHNQKKRLIQDHSNCYSTWYAS